jgi:hypothetical protein
MATDPEYQKKHAEYNKRRGAVRTERRANDPEYLQHTNEAARKRHKERIATDPEYRRKYEENTERQNERRKRLREQAKKGEPPESG